MAQNKLSLTTVGTKIVINTKKIAVHNGNIATFAKQITEITKNIGEKVKVIQTEEKNINKCKETIKNLGLAGKVISEDINKIKAKCSKWKKNQQ